MTPETSPSRIIRTELARAIKAEWPDAVIIAQAMPKAERNTLLAITGFVCLLSDILKPEQQQESRIDSEPENAAPVSKSGCGCGEGDSSLKTQLQVARNIVEFVFQEAEPGQVGRAEIEAFLLVLQNQPPESLSQHLENWLAFVDGVKAIRTAPRIASSASLFQHIDRCTGPIVHVLAEVFVNEGHSAESRLAVEQAGHWLGRTFFLMRLIECAPLDWSHGRMLLPLDILAKHGLRDQAVGNVLSNVRCSDSMDSDALQNVMCEWFETIHASFVECAHHLAECKSSPIITATQMFALRTRSQFDTMVAESSIFQSKQPIEHGRSLTHLPMGDANTNSTWRWRDRLRDLRDAQHGNRSRLVQPWYSPDSDPQ